MQKLVLGMLVLGLFAGAATAQYHDTKYLFGGYGTSSTSTVTTYAQGPYMCNTANQTYMRLGPAHRPATSLSWYYAYDFTMDIDNKKVISFVRGTTSTSYTLRSGIYRTDPATQTVATVYTHPDLFYSTVYPSCINQDGDYMCDCYVRLTSPTTTYQYMILKVDNLGTTINTFFSSTNLGWQGSTTMYSIDNDIDTGNYHVKVYNSNSANNVRYGFLTVSQDGSKFTTWSTGGSYGLYTSSYDGNVRDWSTGNYVTKYSQTLYELTPGTNSRTTLWNIGYPGGMSLYYACRSDLRSAPDFRLVFGAYHLRTNSQNQTYYAPTVGMVDMKTYASTFTVCDPQGLTAPTNNYPYCFDFYQGRHVQTVKIGPKKWQLRFSCPQYALKRYVAAISLTGYKPAIPLADGRKINLAFDFYTQMSLYGLLKPFFDPGPQILDGGGEAQGTLDFSLLPSVDIPIWIALVVVDPAAPSGIAYLPDTIAFRMP